MAEDLHGREEVDACSTVNTCCMHGQCKARSEVHDDRYIELGVQSYNANLAGKALVSAYDSLLAIIADKGAAEASKFVPAQNSTIALANSVVPIEDRGVSASFLKWFTYESVPTAFV